MGSPRLTCTLPNRSFSRGSVRSRPKTLSFSFGLPDELADVGVAFDDALVAEVHRQEHDGPRRIAQEAAHRHGEHAGLRLQQPPGAAAAAFDEVLDASDRAP